MTLKAIDTVYRGYRFRSRLEARWAVFFDHLKIPWEYEPQGFELVEITDEEVKAEFLIEGGSHLGYYLPDFWLPDQQAWFEVKGEYPSDAEWDRLWRFQALAFRADRRRQLYVTTGGIPDPTRVDSHGPARDSTDGWDPIYVFGDSQYAWTRCLICGSYDLQFEARSARNRCGCHGRTPDGGRGHCSKCDKFDLEGRFGPSDRCHNGDDPLILAAYQAARSARFEHGETP